MKYDKLVRDKIPQIIKRKGGVPITHIAKKEEYWEKLKRKLWEELKEFDDTENMEEMADLLEVIYAICSHKKFGRGKLEQLRKKKAKERGGFKKRIILEES